MRQVLSILIADDEEIIVEGIAKTIPWSEYDIEIIGTALSGTEALEIAMNKKVDIVLTDIKMPGLSGIEILEKIKKKYPSIEVVMMSAYKDFDFVHKALRGGAADYLVKPLKKENLISAVLSAAERIRKTETDQYEPLLIYSPLIRKAVDYIDKNPIAKISLEILADELDVHPVHLSRTFRRETGTGFKTYVIEKKIDKAIRLLLDTNMFTYEIAGSLGYENTQHFIKTFKKKTGMTPQDYRKNK